MNIATYVSAASLARAPESKKYYSVALFKDTRTHENVRRDNRLLLQLLNTGHAELVEILGRQSAKDIDKISKLEEIGEEIAWKDGFPYLSSSTAVCDLHNCGWIDAGDHELGLFEVRDWFVGSEDTKAILYTDDLKEMGIL
eukprot:jgi/Bigna1/141416/aug1.62_g16124